MVLNITIPVGKNNMPDGPDIKLKKKPTPSRQIEEDLLTRLILGEAGTESLKGKIAVANVVMNRLNHPKSYLNTVEGNKSITSVITKSGTNSKGQMVYQFESYGNDNMFNKDFVDPESEAFKEANFIAKKAISGELPDITGGSTHFLNPDVTIEREGKLPDWYYNLEKKVTIGGHEFLYEGVR